MKTRTQIINSLRKNLFVIIGLCLCAFFSFHMTFGERSYQRLSELELSAKHKTLALAALKEKNSKMATKASMLRLETLSADMVEERAKMILGYTYQDEIVLMRN